MNRFYYCFSILLFTLFLSSFLQAQVAYIPNLRDGTISVIDLDADEVTTTISTGGNPFAVAVSPDNRKVYVTDINLNRLIEIEVSTNVVTRTVPVGIIPFGVTVSPQTGTIYVANFNSNSVSIIDPVTFTVNSNIASGFRPYGIAHHPSQDIVINANFSGNNLSIIENGRLSKFAPLGLSPVGVIYSADGTKAYTANFGFDNITEFNGNTLVPNRILPAGDAPFGLALNSDGSQLYVSNENSDNVNIINTATGLVEATIPVGDLPSGISVSPDDSKVYVTSRGENSVYVINTTTHDVDKIIKVGTDPRGLGQFIVNPPPPSRIPDITTLRTQICIQPYSASFDGIQDAVGYLVEVTIPSLDDLIISRIISINSPSFTIPPRLKGLIVDIRIAAIFLDDSGNEIIGSFSEVAQFRVGCNIEEDHVHSQLESRSVATYELSITPNPVNDQLYIDIRSPKLQSSNLLIYSLSGQLVREINVDLGINNLTLEVDDLAKGIYILRIQSEAQVRQWKFVKS